MAEISVLLAEGLRDLYSRCRRETGFSPRALLEGLEQYGPIETARRVLRSPASEDFHRLCELRRPDLTVEAFILAIPNRQEIFTAEELETAAARLESCQAQVRRTRIAER